MSLPPKENIIAYGAACLITALGILGNILVISAVKRKRSLRSTTNYLLVNLAILDIITLVFAHLGVLQPFMHLQNGQLADILCKIFLSYNIPYTAVAASVFTVTLVAIERYHAIVKPMRTGIRLKQETLKYAIFGIWVLALVLTLPLYIKTNLNPGSLKCRFNIDTGTIEGQFYKSAGMILTILIPIATISFCYVEIIRNLYFKNATAPQNVAVAEETQNKRKLIKVAFYVTFAFLVCYLPVLIIVFVKDNGYSTIKANSLGMNLALGLLYLEPALNPIIYAYQSTNFREAFKEILKMSDSNNNNNNL